MKYEFPKGFFWGTAASGPQTEGAAAEDGKGKSLWDWWSETDPDKFWQQATPEIACDFYHRFREDIQLLKQTGHNSYRISISWPRIMPTGRGAVNAKGVEFYHKLIDELLANGIEPFVNLYHFDIPYELLKIGGWENRLVADYFVEYAKVCFQEFGSKVKYWFTQNEPLGQVEVSYLFGINYPQAEDAKRTVQAAHNALMSNVETINEFHRLKCPGQIGVIMVMAPSYPASDSDADREAAQLADMLHTYSYLHPLLRGYFQPELIEFITSEGLLPIIRPGDLELIADEASRVDFLGVNYYAPRRIAAGPLVKSSFRDWYTVVELPDVPRSDRGWEIYPEGIYDLLSALKKMYGNIPCIISENGMGIRVEKEQEFVDGDRVHDAVRIEYVRDHLIAAHKAISEGMNVFGYQMWTGLDCFSWRNGYRNVYGLIRVDRADNLKRIIKDSGYWFKTVHDNNGFEG
ncbi:MAG: glycoside hydrolase family 1 protein [Bacillota bacterium]